MAVYLGSGTFSKDPQTGAISSIELPSGERVSYGEAQKMAYERAVEGGDPTGGGYSYSISPFQSPEDYTQAAQQYGITMENPYGTAAPKGFFSGIMHNLAKSFGTTAQTPDLSDLQRQRIMERSYARAINPYNVPGQPGYFTDAGGDIERGIGRTGLRPGEMTSLGEVQGYRMPMSGMDRAAAGLGALLIPGGGLLTDYGTRITGVGERVPTGATPLEGGIISNILTGGQAPYLKQQGGRLLDSVSGKADEILSRGAAKQAGEQQLKGGITSMPIVRRPTPQFPELF